MNILKKIYKQYTENGWGIGFIDNTLEDVVSGKELSFKWVKMPFRNRWFADPFILDVTDNEIVLLGEEFDFMIRRGRLAKLVVDRKTYKLKSWKIILDLPTHLSFPAIIRRNGKVYIYPENSASGKSTIYEYNTETDKMTPVHVICDEPLTDAVYTESFDGRKLLFCTQMPNSNTNVLDIREWEEETKKFEKVGEIASEEKTGRMAGDVFEVNGRYYRPAQESNDGYGHAVVLQEVIYEDGGFSLKEVRRLHSEHPTINIGMHTFNNYKGLIVIDVKGPLYPKIKRLINKFKK